MGSHYEALLAHLTDLQNVNDAAGLLSWDQETNMPKGGADARARQYATLSRIHHEMHTSETTAHLLEAAADEIDIADDDSTPARIIRVAQEDYEQATKLPANFVAEREKTIALAHHTWAEAREAQDFSKFQDTLKTIVEMMMQEAEYRGYEDTPYDALLGKYERGMQTAQVAEIFAAHRPHLVDLIARIQDAPQVDNSLLHQPFAVDKQREFALKMVESFGFDFNRGVQAVSAHPFCANFSKNDVRLTTRFYPEFLNPALFGLMHEAGHGMYEQGIGDALEGLPLGTGTSLAVHESQSRMWENIVGRSYGFWTWAYPQLQATFPQLSNVALDDFYKAINKVEPSFIRIEADEATYNLHIILRFELEQAIINGDVKVEDLPDIWNAKFEQFFGITPPNDALGVLQDVHWSAGLFGYFATYALGNMLSVQYYNQALQAHPTIPDEIANGQFDTLLTWLNQNIHQHGRKFTGVELTERVTGSAIQSDDYMRYLTDKYSAIYGLA
jgi:carboxypeptidase Taq